MELNFIKATNEDKVPIFTMFCKLVKDYEDLQCKDYEKIKTWEINKLNRHITEYDCIHLNNNKVGYIWFSKSGNKMEIDDFFIYPEFRRQGIGSRVLKHFIEETDLPIILYVYKRNLDAIKLYNRMGFTLKKEVDNTRVILENRHQS